MKVGVIMGGISSEREISLMSGSEILNNLNKSKYESIVPIILDSKNEVLEKVKGIDFAFLALHGKFGEDGTIQGILECLDIPYSGCGVLTSAVCMNKGLTKKILKADGILTPKWIVVNSSDELDYDKIKEIGYPVFIKPNSGGSSVATFLIKDEEEVENTVAEVLKYDKEVVIEEYIKGEEITSFVLNGEVFPTLTIKAKSGEFFDYASKYSDNGADEKSVLLAAEIQDKVNDISKIVWNTLGCKGYSRIDMILRDGIPYLLEVNTLPGMTKASLIPKSAKAKGIEYSELLDKMIEY